MKVISLPVVQQLVQVVQHVAGLAAAVQLEVRVEER